jgi:nitroreductase
MDTVTAIRNRRTIKLFTGASVARSEVERLVELACWAPTHRLTQPWRFYACDQAAIQALSARLTTDPELMAVLDPRKAAKAQELLAKVGALVLVTWVRQSDPDIDREDLCAAAAAAQNLLLAATAAGLGSFWSTNPALGHPACRRWCGSDPATEGFVGAIWLGVPAAIPPVPPRLPLGERLSWVDHH